MKWHTVRLTLDSLEDRHVPGNALSMLSMSILPPPFFSISSNKAADSNVVESRIASQFNSGEILTASRSAHHIYGGRDYNTNTHRGIETPSNNWLAPKLNSIFNAHDLQTMARNLTNLKPLTDLTNSPQSTDNRSAIPASDALPTPFASPSLTSMYSGSEHSTDALASFLMQSDTASRAGRTIPKPQMILGNGTIDIACTTTPASGGNPEQTLASGDKLDPGWLSNVNWSDNDDDGWSPASTKTTTADPAATYTPDKDDTYITGGDPDLRKFVIRVTDSQNTPLADFSFKLTFGSSVGVYYSNTKSSAVTSGHVFSNAELTFSGDNGVITGLQTLWLEGRVASASFKDVELKAEYVGGNIPLNKTTDTVKVTVFGVTQTGFFGKDANNPAVTSTPQQPDDPKLHSTTAPKGSMNENGQISWDLQKYIDLKTNTGIDYCAFFHDCMEMQGTVKPPRDANPSVYYGLATHSDDPTIPEAPPTFPTPLPGLVTYEQHRDAYVAAWKKAEGGEWTVKNIPGYPARVWTDDWTNFTSAQANIVTRTESGSHIYFIDNPGYDKKEHSVGLDYTLFYSNLRNAAFIKFYGGTFQASDWARWHTKIDIIPKDANTLTRHPATQNADFGEGWINVPTNIT